MNDERFKWIEHKPHQVLQTEERPLLFQKLPGAEEMWDYEQNTCKPEEITSATSKVTVNWVCDKGHHFQAAPIRFRYKGRVLCRVSEIKSDRVWQSSYDEVLGLRTQYRRSGICNGKVYESGILEMP